MKETLAKKEYDKLKLSESDFNVVVNVLPTLDILSEAINIFGGEKFCTGSIVLPFLVQFLKALDTDEDGIAYINKFKNVLQEEIIARCAKHLNIKLLAKSSFFDKRYSKLKFLPKICEFLQVEVSCDQIIEEIREESDMVELADNEENFEMENPRKKKRFLGLLSDEDEVNIDGGNLDEVSRYIAEGNIENSASPLTWWKGRKEKYPKLSCLARKYLAVQASSTASERVFSLMGNILTKKRLRTTSENFKKLAFLYDC